MFFDGWSGLVRMVAVGVPAYVALILLLRISGKRTLSKFNAFDLIVTVAFGSTLSAGLINENLTVTEVVAAFALLVLLQFVITWTALRWPLLDRIVKSEPQLLYHRGRFLDAAMKRERINEREVVAAVRSQGFGSLEMAEAVVLETDGTFSVIGEVAGPASALEHVRGHY